MKTGFLALAALASAGAYAQSSVTLWGIVDTTVQSVRADGAGKVNRLQSNGLSTSQFGLRGTEDLGGGLAATFWLEAQVSADDGKGVASNANNQPLAGSPAAAGSQGFTFNRRSTVSLAGPWGEVRLGRDAIPAFWNFSIFDPFQTNGIGSSLQMVFGAGVGSSANIGTLVAAVRASNTVGYFLPRDLGGFYGQVMYGLGENASNAPGGTADDGRHTGARFGYAAGNFNVAVGWGTTEYAAGDYVQTNVGGSYAFSFGRVMALVSRDEIKSLANPGQTAYLLGGIFPVGAGEIRASVIRTNLHNSPNDGLMKTLGYVYNLSRRTRLYATVGHVDNKGTGMLYNNGLRTTVAGGNTMAYGLGMAHSF